MTGKPNTNLNFVVVGQIQADICTVILRAHVDTNTVIINFVATHLFSYTYLHAHIYTYTYLQIDNNGKLIDKQCRQYFEELLMISKKGLYIP